MVFVSGKPLKDIKEKTVNQTNSDTDTSVVVIRGEGGEEGMKRVKEGQIEGD